MNFIEWFKAKPKKTQIIFGVIAVIVVIGVVQNYIS
tara:strand:+ start:312 stop:419 length:108 start_codon:yes stop_codon:yes gene_type:complete